jgi:hypothetical protein
MSLSQSGGGDERSISLIKKIKTLYSSFAEALGYFDPTYALPQSLLKLQDASILEVASLFQSDFTGNLNNSNKRNSSAHTLPLDSIPANNKSVDIFSEDAEMSSSATASAPSSLYAQSEAVLMTELHKSLDEGIKVKEDISSEIAEASHHDENKFSSWSSSFQNSSSYSKKSSQSELREELLELCQLWLLISGSSSSKDLDGHSKGLQVPFAEMKEMDLIDRLLSSFLSANAQSDIAKDESNTKYDSDENNNEKGNFSA